MNFDFSSFHPKHNKVLVSRAGSVLVVCMDCGVAADLEAVSGKISSADAFLINIEERMLIGKMSAGVEWKGGKK